MRKLAAIAVVMIFSLTACAATKILLGGRKTPFVSDALSYITAIPALENPEMYAGESLVMTVTAHYADGDVNDVTADSWDVAVGKGSFVGNTYTAPNPISSDETITVTATYQTKTAAATINLNSTEAPTPPSADKIVPGAGWSGATAQPAAVGDPGHELYDANAIAQFDTVPYQTFDANFYVGVVAYHANDINYVSFSIDDGAWVNVSTKEVNPFTDINCYIVKLDITDFDGLDGRHEVRAIAYPKIGEPRICKDLYIYSNRNGTLSNTNRILYVSAATANPAGNDTTGNGTAAAPYLTISKAISTNIASFGDVEGLTIYLSEGSFIPVSTAASGSCNERWLTVQGAPGTTVANVIITRTTSTWSRSELVRYKNLTVVPQCSNMFYCPVDSSVRHIWFDNVVIDNYDRTLAGSAYAVYYRIYLYLTDSIIQNVRNAYMGSSRMMRGCTIESIASDAFYETPLVLSCDVNTIEYTGPADIHADVFQLYKTTITVPVDNMIIADVNGTNLIAEGFLWGATNGKGIENCAIINVTLEFDPSNQYYATKYSVKSNHVYFENLQFATDGDQAWYWTTVPDWEDVYFKNCFWWSMVVQTGTVAGILNAGHFINCSVNMGSFDGLMEEDD